MKRVVIALGGNALLDKKDKPSTSKQFENIQNAIKGIVNLIKSGYKIILTFGNGPQIGNIIIRSEKSKEFAYEIPLDVGVAQSQGEIGYIIEQSLQNELKKQNIKKEVVSILTQVIVDEKDEAFNNPTKPIGPFYNKKEAEELKKSGLVLKEVIGGFRRVVPSPKPKRIIEARSILELIERGFIVIATGGGGIPIIEKNNSLKGIPAVIDKDLASSKLASNINADILVILTNINGVYINFNKENKKKLEKIKLNDIEKYYKELQFPEGSMGPKIEAAINFLKNGGKEVIITSIEDLDNSIYNGKGTHITK